MATFFRGGGGVGGGGKMGLGGLTAGTGVTLTVLVSPEGGFSPRIPVNLKKKTANRIPSIKAETRSAAIESGAFLLDLFFLVIVGALGSAFYQGGLGGYIAFFMVP